MIKFKQMMPVALLATLSLAPLATVLADHAGTGGAVELQGVSAEMTRLAQAFLATLTDEPSGLETSVGYDRKALALLEPGDPGRIDYVYWPLTGRKGLRFDYMTGEQRTLVHDMLTMALSAKGYLSAVQVMQLERILEEQETAGFPRGIGAYTLAFFGEPSADSRWGWRFEGHHLSLNFSVAPGEVSVTPSFFGASPAEIRTGIMAGFRNLRSRHDAGFALINALDETQRAEAIEDGNPPFDIVSGTLNRPAETWDDWKKLPAQGIEVSKLTAQQKDMVQGIIDDVITVYRPEIAQSYLQQVDVNDLRFVWLGGTNDGDAHYWRLEGPDFFFEYDLVQGMGNHVHTVWRSKSGDFGGDLLMQHHQESH